MRKHRSLTPCPECGKMLYPMGLWPHRARMHGVHSTKAGPKTDSLDLLRPHAGNVVQVLLEAPEIVREHLQSEIHQAEEEIKRVTTRLHQLEHLQHALSSKGPLLVKEERAAREAKAV